MNSKENENNQKENKSNSTTIDLEKLQQKYNTLLAQYKSAVYEYTNFLSQQANKPKNTQMLVSIKGYAFNGTGIAGQSQATTLQDCEAECAKLSNCSGATFVSNKCLLRSGDSPIMLSSQGSYAIILKSKQLLLNMEYINQQLMAINKQIVNKIKTSEPKYYKYASESSKNTQELINNYDYLTSEREKILNLLRQYETLDEAENQNQIKINQNYYSYILLSILAIAVIFLLYKVSIPSIPSSQPVVQSSGELGISAYYIVFFLIFLTLGIHYFYKYFPY
jgi:hypothetical protein